MKLNIDDVSLAGKRVLVRVDFNVPLNLDGSVADDTRISATLPTIRKIIDSGGSAILMSHLGRPKGQIKPEFSLKPVAVRLAELIGKPVQFAPDCVGEEVELLAVNLQAGELLLLENLRFHPEEEGNDPEFAKKIARLGDLYINDAFGAAHRAHASTQGVADCFPQSAAAGYLMQKELDYLGKAVADPERPFIAIIGGSKISGKIDVITNLLKKVDLLLIGGGMTYTFVKSAGRNIGKSLCEEDKLEVAKSILNSPEGDNILLPVDSVCASGIEEEATEVHQSNDIPDHMMGLDIGPVAVAEFRQAILDAKTVIWNGPIGMFEKAPFEHGTRAIAQALAEVTAHGGVTIVGGGDSVAALNKFGLSDKMSHVSTGGGASLEFLEGKVLPGVAVLTDKEA
ncbi:phosphoglycerate kinase [Calditrichota bacterium]